MNEDELRALEEHADWLEDKGTAAIELYERGRYFGKAEGIRFAVEYFMADV